MIHIRRLAPHIAFYTGAVIEIIGPRDNRFILWPEEKWAWEEADGRGRGGFAHEQNILDFRQDEAGGAISYRLDMAPEGCETQVRVIPGEDTVVIEHEIDNRGQGRVRGGSPTTSGSWLAGRRRIIPNMNSRRPKRRRRGWQAKAPFWPVSKAASISAGSLRRRWFSRTRASAGSRWRMSWRGPMG